MNCDWVYNLNQLFNEVPSSSVNTFYCACDVNDQGAKKFASFKSFVDFEKFYKDEKVKNYYEIIKSENKSKLYLDLDIPNVSLNVAEKILCKIQSELESFLLIHCNTGVVKYEISESHSENKKSFHICVKNVLCSNQKQRFLFGKEFSKFISSDLSEYFDMSVYSKNRCFRLLGSSKYGQSRSLVALKGYSKKLKDHCVSSGFSKSRDNCELIFDEVVYRNDIQISNTPENIAMILKAIDVRFWENRSSWLQIGCAMKNIGLSFSEFDLHSQKASNYGGTRKLWDSIRCTSLGDSGLGTLYYYASKCESFVPEDVSSLTNLQQKCIKSILELGTLTHSNCCKLFHSEYPDYYIYSNNTWYLQLDCGRYTQIDIDTDTILSSHISQYFDHFERDIISSVPNEGDRKILMKAKSLTEKYEFKTSIIKELKQHYNEPNLLSKLDSKTHLIGFDNGVYDLVQKEFRKATIDDCVSWSVGFDYIDIDSCSADTIDYLENFVYSLFENKDTGKYFLKHIGSFLFGGNKEELIHFWVGNGRNGKGTIDDILRETLGPYYHVLEDAFFTTSKKNQDEASPTMIALKNVRLTMTTEPEGNTSYLSSKFKRICGNDPIHCRSLYSNQMQTFIPTFKPVIQTNHLPNFTDVDVGLLQRIRVINFCYTFVKPTEYDSSNKYHKLIDIELKTNLRNMKKEFMALLIKWYHIYTKESLDTPSKDIIEVTKSYRSDIDSVQTFINSATTHCEGGSISTIDLLYNYNGWSKEKMSRNVFAQRLKGNFKVQTVKNNGRLLTCLIDREWIPDFA